MATPGFLKDGIDFYTLLCAYAQDGRYRIETTDLTECTTAIDLMKHVIGDSYGYHTGFASTVPGRFQMIFNSTIQEAHIFATARSCGMELCKRSNSTWLLDGSAESGTDFYYNDIQIEAKVYKNWSNMLSYAEQGSADPTVFHNADYVLCYLIERPWPEELMKLDCTKELVKTVGTAHWYWLKKIDGQYVVYFNDDLYDNTYRALSPIIPICKCRLTQDKLSVLLDTNAMY